VSAPTLISHPSSLAHDTGSHPERAERILAIERELDSRPELRLERQLSDRAPRASLEAVHDPSHVERIERLCAAGGGYIDLDTVASEMSWEAALHAAGGALGLVDAFATGSAESGFSIHRPPGHHADAGRAMGFCLFNNVAVAAQHALDAHGLSRLLILDWDVHHGNGTNDIFHDTDAVLYVSIHQSPLFPGSGSWADEGSGRGLGHTVNLPVAAGAGDELFTSLVAHVVAPLARLYRPEMVLVSAGYDAHEADPLAECELTEDGFRAMTRCLRGLSLELGVGLGFVLEGGYDLGALARSVAATLEVLTEQESAPVDAELHPEALVARRRLDARWPGLSTA
jgi:acetoin utilization deacetylase AcuC-like enzyme